MCIFTNKNNNIPEIKQNNHYIIKLHNTRQLVEMMEIDSAFHCTEVN